MKLSVVSPIAPPPKHCFFFRSEKNEEICPLSCRWSGVDTPWGLAKAYVDETATYLLANDGWNADGSMSRSVNRIPYSDFSTSDSAGNTWTAYRPQNTPYDVRKDPCQILIAAQSHLTRFDILVFLSFHVCLRYAPPRARARSNSGGGCPSCMNSVYVSFRAFNYTPAPRNARGGFHTHNTFLYVLRNKGKLDVGTSRAINLILQLILHERTCGKVWAPYGAQNIAPYDVRNESSTSYRR